MIRWCVPMIAMLAGLAGASAPAGGQEAPGTAIYRDEAIGFSMAPPAFEADPDAPNRMIAMFTAPPEDGFSANLNVIVQRAKFDAVVEATDAQLEAAGFELLSKQTGDVAGHPTVEYLYTGTVQERRLKFIALVVGDGDRVFLLTGTAPEQRFDAYEPVFRGSISSFKPAR